MPISILIPLGPERSAAAALSSLRAAGITAEDEVILAGDGFLPEGSYETLPCPLHCIACPRQNANRARNAAAAAAKHDWLCFLDDDDAYLPNALNRLRHELQHSARAVFCLSTVRLSGRRPPNPGHRLRLHRMQKRNLAGSCSTLLVHKDFFERIGGFDTDLSAMQDWDFWLRAMGEHVIPVLHPPLVRYDDLGCFRMSKDLSRRVSGLEALLEKHGSSWSPGTRALHRARLADAKFRAGISPRRKIWQWRAPMASIYYLVRSYGGGAARGWQG
jgi:glycosyltransferase involved in cell wall biosynthesis